MDYPWGRLLTAMITPYDVAGNVDHERACRLAEHLIDHGCDGVVVAGTTGESPVLSSDEKEHLYVSIKERIGQRGLVIAATGSNHTKNTVDSTVRAAKLGLDGVMIVVPYYNKPSQEGLYQHFYSVAQSSDLPVMIYNIPSRTGASISPDTVARLAELPTIKAFKAATGDVLEISHIRRLTKNLLLYSGDDPLTLPLLSVGAHGVVSVASHLASLSIKTMINLFVEHHPEQALELHDKLLALFEVLFIDGNPASVKVALEIMGFPTGGLRLPLVSPGPHARERIENVLASMDSRLLDSRLE
ncbi:4-hydroxy-tetrahydrodipicolinate synthase [Alicyclobacillus sp. ALC3]|uniref:4-hydroxy-tetrahydrodipicolinate synthase n=1 Tax=Alicyclobacillus sp. ALC3 TaxID=2796143 RepID=UPI002379D52A|nr:4-hydroxy-tetrahydrodipicolinate synthase [Alicyclobacillus sp. ALC3]WDL98548.1 4-hydroxy-tetrahydrodipicolinate synthase [Alicyclobacillus sp. ALC3]